MDSKYAYNNSLGNCIKHKFITPTGNTVTDEVLKTATRISVTLFYTAGARITKEIRCDKSVDYNLMNNEINGAKYIDTWSYNRKIGTLTRTTNSGLNFKFGLQAGKFPLFEYRIVSILFVVIITLLVCDVDERTKMKQLLIPTATGYKKISGVKAVTIVVGVVIIFAIAYVPWIFSIFESYGNLPLDIKAYSLPMLSRWAVSMRSAAIVFYSLHLLGLLGISGFAVYLYRRFGKWIPAASVCCGLGLCICAALMGAG